MVQNWWQLLSDSSKVGNVSTYGTLDCSVSPSAAHYLCLSQLYTVVRIWREGYMVNKSRYHLIIKLLLSGEDSNRKWKSFLRSCHMAFMKIKAEQAEVLTYNINRKILKKLQTSIQFSIGKIPTRCSRKNINLLSSHKHWDRVQKKMWSPPSQTFKYIDWARTSATWCISEIIPAWVELETSRGTLQPKLSHGSAEN